MSKHNAREPFSKREAGRIRRTQRQAKDVARFAWAMARD